eukprot:PhF_6_TR30114/c0_g1_i1/m.43982
MHDLSSTLKAIQLAKKCGIQPPSHLMSNALRLSLLSKQWMTAVYLLNTTTHRLEKSTYETTLTAAASEQHRESWPATYCAWKKMAVDGIHPDEVIRNIPPLAVCRLIEKLMRSPAWCDAVTIYGKAHRGTYIQVTEKDLSGARLALVTQFLKRNKNALWKETTVVLKHLLWQNDPIGPTLLTGLAHMLYQQNQWIAASNFFSHIINRAPTKTLSPVENTKLMDAIASIMKSVSTSAGWETGIQTLTAVQRVWPESFATRDVVGCLNLVPRQIAISILCEMVCRVPHSTRSTLFSLTHYHMWEVACAVMTLCQDKPQIPHEHFQVARSKLGMSRRSRFAGDNNDQGLRIMETVAPRVPRGGVEWPAYALLLCHSKKWEQAFQLFSAETHRLALPKGAFEYQCYLSMMKFASTWKIAFSFVGALVQETAALNLSNEYMSNCFSRGLVVAVKDASCPEWYLRCAIGEMTRRNLSLDPEAAKVLMEIRPEAVIEVATRNPTTFSLNAYFTAIASDTTSAISWRTALDVLLSCANTMKTPIHHIIESDPRVDNTIVKIMSSSQWQTAVNMIHVFWPHIPDLSKAPGNLITQRAEAVLSLALVPNMASTYLPVCHLIAPAIKPRHVMSIFSYYSDTRANVHPGLVKLLKSALQPSTPLPLPLIMEGLKFGNRTSSWEFTLWVFEHSTPSEVKRINACGMLVVTAAIRTIRATSGRINPWFRALQLIQDSELDDDITRCVTDLVRQHWYGALWLHKKMFSNNSSGTRNVTFVGKGFMAELFALHDLEFYFR